MHFSPTCTLESVSHDVELRALLLELKLAALVFGAQLGELPFEAHALFGHVANLIIVTLLRRLHPSVHLPAVAEHQEDGQRLQLVHTAIAACQDAASQQ